MKLSLLTQISGSTLAVGLGGYISKIESNFMSSSIKEKYKKIMEEVRAERAVARKYYQDLKNLRDKITREKTGGKNTRFENLNNATLYQEIETETNKQYKKLIEAESNPDLKKAMRSAAFGGLTDANKKLTAAIAKHFPNEYKLLEPYYTKQQQLYDETVKTQENGKDSMNREDRHKLWKNFDAKQAELEKQFETNLAKASPQTRLVNELIKYGNSYDKYQKGPLVAKARELAKNEAKAKIERIKIGTTKAAGVGILGVASLGLISADSVIDKNALSKCKSDLNLSDDEIRFYDGKSHLFSPSKIKSKRSLSNSCDRLQIDDPEGTLETLKKDLGYIPVGTCNIIKNESGSSKTRM